MYVTPFQRSCSAVVRRSQLDSYICGDAYVGRVNPFICDESSIVVGGIGAFYLVNNPRILYQQ